jgi:hypothetical protein
VLAKKARLDMFIAEKNYPETRLQNIVLMAEQGIVLQTFCAWNKCNGCALGHFAKR